LISTQHQLSGNSSFQSPFRHTVSYSVGLFWDVGEHTSLHPYLRSEYLSDLDRGFSFHPGMGWRTSVSPDLSFRGNFAYLSRAPNFNELYFEQLPLFIGNRMLVRQKSIQADVGYEWTPRYGSQNFRIEQVFFSDRTSDFLQSTRSSAGIYQVKNVGTRINVGLENSVEWQPRAWFQTVTAFTWQYSSLNDRYPAYQPARLLRIEPKFTSPSKSKFSLSAPVYMRSATKGLSGRKMREQVDVGLKLQGEVLHAHLTLTATNLLGWRREETEDYPLSHETEIRLNWVNSF
jgi:hypothetical protein